MKNSARGKSTGITAANPTAFETALEDLVSDRFDPPVVRLDPLALDPPIAAAAREVRRNWTAQDRISRAPWAFARGIEALTTPTSGFLADSDVEG